MGSVPSSASTASEKAADNSSSGYFSDPAAQNRTQENTLLSSRIRELEKQLSEQKKNQKTVLADRLAFFKKYHGQFYMPTLEGNLKITPEMAELLGLSKEEQQAVEQHLAQIKSEMDKLEDDNTVLAKQTANSATFETSADPQGKTIKARLDSLLSSDIGDERAELLTSYIYNGSSNTFSGFAEQKREIEISWTVQNGNPLYTFKESYLGPDGNVTTSRGNSGDSLPPQYQKLLQEESGH